MRRAAPSCQRKLERGICKRSERAGLSNQEPSGLWDGKEMEGTAWRKGRNELTGRRARECTFRDVRLWAVFGGSGGVKCGLEVSTNGGFWGSRPFVHSHVRECNGEFAIHVQESKAKARPP